MFDQDQFDWGQWLELVCVQFLVTGRMCHPIDDHWHYLVATLHPLIPKTVPENWQTKCAVQSIRQSDCNVRQWRDGGRDAGHQ